MSPASCAAVTDRVEAPAHSYPKLMIVDDDRDICELYELILHGGAWEVVAAVHNGRDAVALFRDMETKPDIVLLDYNLPGYHGLEVAALMREIDPSVRFVICSAYPTAFSRFAELGGCVCVAKPFAPGAITRALDFAVR